MKESWKPGTLIYPLPAVLVSCGATPEEYNLHTVPVHATVSRLYFSFIKNFINYEKEI